MSSYSGKEHSRGRSECDETQAPGEDASDLGGAATTSASDAVYVLIDADGRSFSSSTPGTLGGHRRGRRYGRLDCPAAARALARGGYRGDRVFFADEATAIAAGYRPCACCLPDAYRRWRDLERRELTVGPGAGLGE